MAEDPILEIIPEIKALISEQSWPGVNLLLGDVHPPDVAEHWDEFTREEKLAILRHGYVARAVDIFEELETERQVALIQLLREERAADLLDEMAPDERADLFAEFPPELAERFLRLMETEEADDVRELLTHEPDTAGGIMTTDFAWCLVTSTVGEAIRQFRENFHEAEAVYFVYVLGENDRLEGVVTLRQLMLTPDETPVRKIMHTNLVTITPDLDREDAARQCADYNLIALPVVDDSGEMLGIVTHDDVMDVLEEEAAEDLELFGAVIPGDEERSYLRTPVLQHCRARIPWLVVLLFLSSISALLLLHYEEVMKSGFDLMWYGLLFSLTPMLCATAGNAGTQSATVVIRDLATGDLDVGEIGRVFLKELAVGLLMGAILAACGFVRALISENISFDQAMIFGGIIAVSIFLAIAFATTAGALLPLIVKRVNLDPAVMSSPLLATIIDNVAILIYFSVGIAALMHLAPGGLSP
jgi:magnesium transporter